MTEAKPKLARYVEPEGEDKSELYHDPDKLMRASNLANIISWVILVATVLFWIVNVVLQFQQGAAQSGALGILLVLLNSMVLPLLGAFFFAMLQMFAEGVYLLMDIEDHLRK